MGKFFVYVLKSVSSGKHYTGQTNDIHRRIYEHNAEILGKFTKNKGPWILIFSKEFDSRAEAMQYEKYLKSGVGRDFLKNNVT
ncbi:MAG TPA: GIY-YIG nuclease family protein, partial [Bacteroidales bacterium]|nr:GIY-YIG nuclease family protein [Bacteroidales bacterium]HPS18403.1 GIY-YIG nuclease family protein [Bacteroidales bacterium]